MDRATAAALGAGDGASVRQVQALLSALPAAYRVAGLLSAGCGRSAASAFAACAAPVRGWPMVDADVAPLRFGSTLVVRVEDLFKRQRDTGIRDQHKPAVAGWPRLARGGW